MLPRPHFVGPEARPDQPVGLPTIFLKLNTEKIKGKGEDAEPIATPVGAHLGAVAVFDGMGGAGANRIMTPEGEQTQARVASRLARDTVVEALKGLGPGPLSGTTAFAEELIDQLCRRLADKVAELKIGASKYRSTIIRTLPTTLALALYQTDVDRLRVQAIWAGDSRIYLLTQAGLQQLSDDDLRSAGDALANLRDDSPLSNMVQASGPFVLNTRSFQLKRGPAILFAATDGCFGYVPTPWHFEQLLVESLTESKNAEKWVDEIANRIGKVAGDDCTMGIAIIDHADFSDLKAMVRGRRNWLSSAVKQYDGARKPLEESRKQFDAEEKRFREAKQRYDEAQQRHSKSEENHRAVEASFNDAVNDIWSEYRARYEAKLELPKLITTSRSANEPMPVGKSPSAGPPPGGSAVDSLAPASPAAHGATPSSSADTLWGSVTEPAEDSTTPVVEDIGGSEDVAG